MGPPPGPGEGRIEARYHGYSQTQNPALQQRQRRAYHDTGLGKGKSTAASKEYEGTKSARAKKVARDERRDRERARARLERDADFAEMSDTMMDYLEDEFTSVFLAILYVLHRILHLSYREQVVREQETNLGLDHRLVCAVVHGHHSVPNRAEDRRWTVDGITKFYFRLQELSRSDAATVHETLEKWWEWRKVQKPPRVFGV